MIQILSDSTPHLCRVRLYETAPGEESPYACLSHCWGDGQLIKTETASLHKRKAEILWKELPKTFQEAIEFTLRLGLEFLWIDSLCIIQDDPWDWEEEATKMAAYFSNARTTLAAAAAENSAMGLFSMWKLQEEPIELQGMIDSQPYHLIARTPIIHSLDVNCNSPKFPLLGRGWVYQEITLSRRVLYFTSRELVWSCSSDAYCQCGLVQEKPWPYIARIQEGYIGPIKTYEPPDELTGAKRDEPWRLWHLYVSDISGRKFTYIQD